MYRFSPFRQAWFSVLFLSGVIALLVVPSLPATADTVKAKGTIVAADNINPNFQGRPSPVRLVLYQLASADAFQNADFRSVYDENSDVLGDDLLKRSVQILQPDETVEFEEEFEEGTRYLGVVAGFRNLEQAEWRSVVELEEKGLFSLHRNNRLTIEIDELSVKVTLE